MQYDAIVVGGGFAGLSAALYLARSRRSVLVVDSGRPRNRFAKASHGFLGQDGENPKDILATAQRQLLVYPEATLIKGEAVDAEKRGDLFHVAVGDGETANAINLVLATGVADALPDIPGLAERWGKSVAHCPYCHGYEFDGAPLGVLATSPQSLHQARMLPQWGPTTFFVNDKIALGEAERAELDARGVTIETTRVAALDGYGDSLSGVRLVDGRQIQIAGLFLQPTMRMASALPHRFGCDFEETAVGSFVRTDALKQTSVPGLYAIGDMSRAWHNVAFAVADGAVAAGAINHSRLAAASSPGSPRH